MKLKKDVVENHNRNISSLAHLASSSFHSHLFNISSLSHKRSNLHHPFSHLCSSSLLHKFFIPFTCSSLPSLHKTKNQQGFKMVNVFSWVSHNVLRIEQRNHHLFSFFMKPEFTMCFTSLSSSSFFVSRFSKTLEGKSDSLGC